MHLTQFTLILFFACFSVLKINSVHILYIHSKLHILYSCNFFFEPPEVLNFQIMQMWDVVIMTISGGTEKPLWDCGIKVVFCQEESGSSFSFYLV